MDKSKSGMNGRIEVYQNPEEAGIAVARDIFYSIGRSLKRFHEYAEGVRKGSRLPVTDERYVLATAGGSSTLVVAQALNGIDYDFSEVPVIVLDEYAGTAKQLEEQTRRFSRFGDKISPKADFITNDELESRLRAEQKEAPAISFARDRRFMAHSENNPIIPDQRDIYDKLSHEIFEFHSAIGKYNEYHWVDHALLGLGADGHLISNYAGTDFYGGTHLSRSKNGVYTITVGIKTLLDDICNMPRFRELVILAFGEEKANAVYQMVEGDYDQRNPSSVMRHLHSNVRVVVDEAAAKDLSKWRKEKPKGLVSVL